MTKKEALKAKKQLKDNSLAPALSTRSNDRNLRDRKQINQNEIKTVLSSYLEFPVSEKDIEDFMAECDPSGSGQVHLNTFAKLYLS
jgi:Ca2+-binding EF-hand superfamily protein